MCERLSVCIEAGDWTGRRATDWWQLNLPERTTKQTKNVLELEPQEVLRVLR